MKIILAPNTPDLNPTQVIAHVVNIQVNVREEVFEEDEEDRPAPEPSICYFDPNNEACDPLPGGGCPPGSHFNEDGRCIPDGRCPDGYGTSGTGSLKCTISIHYFLGTSAFS
jgi:hypothetical protein